VATLAHAHDLTVSPVGTSPIGLVHAATSVPNHIAAELQDLTPAVGLTLEYASRMADTSWATRWLGVRGDEVATAAIGARTWPSGAELSDGPHVRPQDAGRRLLPQPRDGRPLTAR
jgi:hypothetical protein